MNDIYWESVWKKFDNNDVIIRQIGDHLMKLHQRIQKLEKKIEENERRKHY